MKKKLSDFLKQAYELDLVKDVSEAFKNYPPEEEWHQGKIESFLEEPKEYYSVYNIGDIVYVKNFEYTNKKKGNNHLFVIIDLNNMAVPIENIAMLISSKVKKVKFEANQLLPKNEINGLAKDSIVKTDVVYKILNKDILFRIGTIDEETIAFYKNSYQLLTEKK